MMSLTVSLLLDVIVVMLLGATIVYSYTLNRRLSTLRAGREELEKLVRDFTDATIRADESIQSLKITAEESSNILQQRIKRSENLRDEVSFMLSRGEELAQQLEQHIGAARRTVGGKSSATTSITPQTRADEQIGNPQEEELKKALKGLR